LIGTLLNKEICETGMKKYILLFIIILNSSRIFAHCQIPCGIYDDVLRIIQIKEDFQTIEKAMLEINNLSNDLSPLSLNQLNRWVIEKEKHSSKIQNIIADYFLTQRIKETNLKYIEQTTTLQKLLVLAMKCKQTTEIDNVEKALQLVASFSKIYFDSHGIKHLEELSH
tara:strand:+ start:62 stop:568 length:507 start_codon:yes stop_codon:yes gene_type:complete